MRVMHGQYGLRAPNDEFGAANRYYFAGLGRFSGGSGSSRIWKASTAPYSRLPRPWQGSLPTDKPSKNVQGLCELITAHDEAEVRRAIGDVAALPARSLKRRLAYVSALVSGRGRAGAH